jgi:hypothetical protein
LIRKTVDKTNLHIVQPLSARMYVIIAAAGFAIAVGFTFFFIYRVPQLVESGFQGQIFYLLLIPWALSCAAFLFGAMRSYARFTDNQVGTTLELGGPVVLFGLVVLGGFKLVPSPPEVIDLAVVAQGNDTPLITDGTIILDLPGLPHAKIGPDGQANFTISGQYKGMPIRVLAEVDGYVERWQTPRVRGNVLDVDLERTHPLVVLTGSLYPLPSNGKTITILVDGQDHKSSPDDLGTFSLNVDGKAGDRIRLKVYEGRKLIYDDFQLLPGPVTLHLKPSR